MYAPMILEKLYRERGWYLQGVKKRGKVEGLWDEKNEEVGFGIRLSKYSSVESLGDGLTDYVLKKWKVSE